jgi:hypothetical protein
LKPSFNNVINELKLLQFPFLLVWYRLATPIPVSSVANFGTGTYKTLTVAFTQKHFIISTINTVLLFVHALFSQRCMECSLYRGEEKLLLCCCVAGIRERIVYKPSIVVPHWSVPSYVFISSPFNYYANSVLGSSHSWRKEVLEGPTLYSPHQPIRQREAVLSHQRFYQVIIILGFGTCIFLIIITDERDVK